MVLVKLLSRTSDKSANAEVKSTVSPSGHLAEPAPPSMTAPSQPSAETRPSVSIYSSDTRQDGPASPAVVATELTVTATQAPSQAATDELKPPPTRARRFSWRGISLFNGHAQEEHKPALSASEEQKKKAQVAEDKVKRALKMSSADRKARESAIIVRSLIVGQHAITVAETKGKPAAKPKISRVKAELLQPKKANRVIAQLRAFPSHSESLPPVAKLDTALEAATPAHPIHAVCLPMTDAEANEQHFSKLSIETATHPQHGTTERILNLESALAQVASVYNTSVAQLKEMFAEMHVVDLLTADLGIGEPGDGSGLLSGCVPTPKTIIDGVEELTPELMSLGYATGKVLIPDHSGIHPPTDRMSVLTYWWGFEVILPPPSIKYLSQAPSIAHSAINVLTALSVLNGGVRELLPFVRYISSFIDTEFNMIKQEDRGKGVVCAATWLIPTALVPRPWDFPDAPIVKVQPVPGEAAPEHDEQPSSPMHDEPSRPDPESDDSTSAPPMSPLSPTSPTPSLPPLPASPTLLPPLPSFDSDEAPAKAPPVDDTPVDVNEATHINGDTNTEKDVPAVAVVPPTPPTSNTLRGTSEIMAALSGTVEA